MIKLKKLYVLFLALMFGFAKEVAAQYGVISYYFEIKGKVKTEDNKPIKGIMLYIDGDTIMSDDNGCFNYYKRAYTDYNIKFLKIVATDIDGPDNGGEFKSVEWSGSNSDIIFDEKDKKSSYWEHFYEPNGIIEIRMKRKEDQ